VKRKDDVHAGCVGTAADPRGAAAAPAGPLDEQRIDGRQVYDGVLLDVRRDRVRLPDGSESAREYVVHGGAVLVVPVLPDGRLVVERQFRYPLARVFLEFPAGKIDPGEDPLTTARREMIEETGFEVGRLTPLAVLHPVISYSTEEIRCYVGEDLREVGARLDHGEFLEVEARALDELLEALERGEITDAKTVSALLLYARRLGR
jgi:ADP-ribose pyrophosphatase